jgi:hypothetical protein
MTHTCRSCSNHHICRLSLSPATPTYIHPLTRHEAQILLRHCKWTWRTPLLEFFVEDIMDENFLHIVWYDVLFNITVSLYVMPCSLVEKNQCSIETLAFTRAEGQGSRPNCNGAYLPIYAMLQLTRHWLSLICFLKLKSLRSQMTVCTDNDHMVIHQHLEWHFVSCLWTSTLYQMVIYLLLFTQQYGLWATQFNGFFCIVWCVVRWCVCGELMAPPRLPCVHVDVYGVSHVCVEQFVGCGVSCSVRWSVWCVVWHLLGFRACVFVVWCVWSTCSVVWYLCSFQAFLCVCVCVWYVV